MVLLVPFPLVSCSPEAGQHAARTVISQSVPLSFQLSRKNVPRIQPACKNPIGTTRAALDPKRRPKQALLPHPHSPSKAAQSPGEVRIARSAPESSGPRGARAGPRWAAPRWGHCFGRTGSLRPWHQCHVLDNPPRAHQPPWHGTAWHKPPWAPGQAASAAYPACIAGVP